MTEKTAAQISAARQLRSRAAWEEASQLEDHAIRMRTLAGDARLEALSRYSTFYREVRQGYLDAEIALRQASVRIKAKTYD